MAFVEGISDEEAEGRVAELYEAERANLGYVPNYTRVLSHRPAVYEAWQELREAIRKQIDPRRYELATLAAARRLRSSYCSLAHGKVLADEFLPAETVRAAAIDHRSAGLEPLDVAVMDLAAKVAGDANSVSQADIDRLRDLGLSDADIVDVVLAAAARSFFSKAVEALGAEPDPAFAELEPELRDALTVGRPIAGLR
jgi:uncharacterized peroxidase-related enzyme